MAIEVTKTDDKAWIGYTIMFIFFIVAIYIGIKHYKNPGFWYGVGAMFLLAITVNTGENASFDSAFLSVSNNKK